MKELVLHAKSASVIATATGVIVTIKDLEPGINQPNAPVVAHPGALVRDTYDSVATFAEHRGISEKTVRRLLHLLPHSVAGGIRLNRAEADKKMDSLPRPRRRRRQRSTKAEESE